VRLLVALGPKGLPRLDTIALDGSAFLFMLIVAVLSAVIFGLAPALASSRTDLQGTLKEGGRGAGDGVRRRRLRAVLVASEFGMALVLLVGAGLVLRSFGALLRVDPGFEPAGVLSLKVSVKGTAEEPLARRLLFYRTLLERVAALPGVQAASAINHVPLNGDDWNFSYAVEGAPLPAPGEGPHAHFLIVRPRYFETMRIPLAQGRDFTPDDEMTGAKVVIVSEAMAAKQWPGRSPIGQRITVDDAATHPDWFTVVGVAHDVRQGSWAGDDGHAMYFPSMAGEPYPWKAQPLVTFLNPNYMTLVVRSSGTMAAVRTEVESVIRSMDPDVAVSQVLTLEEAIEQQLTTPKFYVILLGVFAGVALVLAAVGVYGVISYSVTRRTHEIGVRLALGARRSEAFGLVVKQGMTLAIAGTAAGLVIALLATRFLRTLLYGVSPNDPLTFAVVAAVLAVVALVACCIPARRASKVDPMTALRCD
jgi:predicted permease